MNESEKAAYHALRHVLAALAATDHPSPADVPAEVADDVAVLREVDQLDLLMLMRRNAATLSVWLR